MGCCNSRLENDNEIKGEQVTAQGSETKVEAENIKIEEDCSKVKAQRNDNIIYIIEEETPEISSTRRTGNEIIKPPQDTVKVELPEEEGVKPKKKAKSKIPITIAQSEPQNLDPNEVYFVENKNPKPNRNKTENLQEVKNEIKRQSTIDKILEEKIKGKADFEELLNDENFNKLIK
jgi:hypothetical protein